jgi:hypothetical protein
LFVRPYPAAGVKIVPVTFVAGGYGYFVIGLWPVSAILFFGFVLRDQDLHPRPMWALPGLAGGVFGLLVVIASLRRVKLEIRTDGVSYTGPLRKDTFIPYSEISSVVLIDYRHVRTQVTSRSIRTSSMIITPKPTTAKSVLKIPLTLFSESVQFELVRLFRPEEWESDT